MADQQNQLMPLPGETIEQYQYRQDKILGVKPPKPGALYPKGYEREYVSTAAPPDARRPEYKMPGGTPRLGQNYVMPSHSGNVAGQDESARRPFVTPPSDSLDIVPDDVEGLGRATDDFWPGIEMDQTTPPAWGGRTPISYKKRGIHIINHCKII